MLIWPIFDLRAHFENDTSVTIRNEMAVFGRQLTVTTTQELHRQLTTLFSDVDLGRLDDGSVEAVTAMAIHMIAIAALAMNDEVDPDLRHHLCEKWMVVMAQLPKTTDHFAISADHMLQMKDFIDAIEPMDTLMPPISTAHWNWIQTGEGAASQ